jgi:transcriptional regulator GlxA family with amidase domain
MFGNFKTNWGQLVIAARYDCKELAKLNKMSIRQLQRIFRNELRRTPQDWMNEQRILAAQQLLRTGDPVKKVALELGFKQSSHFCRQFKLVTGVTPSQFKHSTVEILDVAVG